MRYGASGDLTQREYWDDLWSNLRGGTVYADLRWVRRNCVYASLDHLFRSFLPVDPSKTFIELGSGPGRWLIYFYKTFGYQVYGCDWSAPSCELARTNLIQAGVPGTILQSNFFQLRGQYDLVFSAGVIEHFEEPKAVLMNFVRLVRPGGILITSVPNLRGLNRLYWQLLKPETLRTHRVIKLTDLRQWHREMGLQELVGTCYGSIYPSRVPLDAFKGVPWLQRHVWTPVYAVASGGINRICLFLQWFGLRFDHPLISPHLLVSAKKPAEA